MLHQKKESFQLGVASFVSFVIVAGLFCIFYIRPVVYVHFIAEDSWGEYATFVFYFLAFMILAFILFYNKDYRKPGYWLISFCFFFMAMEEISWGQRLLGLETPELIGALNRQGETTLHNLVRINRLFRILSIIILLWAAGLPWLMKKYHSVKRLVNKLGIPVASNYLLPFFIAAVFFIIGKPLPRAVELGEMIMGLAFFSYSFDLLQLSLKEQTAVKIPVAVQIIWLGFFVFFMTNFLVTNWPNNNALRLRYCDFVVSELPERQLEAQSESIMRYLIKNPDLMTVEFLDRIFLILKKYHTVHNSGNTDNRLVHDFLHKNDIKFSLFQKRKAFNLRKTDFNDQRALVLFSIGVEYYRLNNYKKTADYFKNSLKYMSEKKIIDQNARYFAKVKRNLF